jgi:hypothetical protein
MRFDLAAVESIIGIVAYSASSLGGITREIQVEKSKNSLDMFSTFQLKTAFYCWKSGK